MQENVSGFQPKAEDLQYPEKLLVAQQAGQDGLEGSETEIEPAETAQSREKAVNGNAAAEVGCLALSHFLLIAHCFLEFNTVQIEYHGQAF